MGAGGAVELSGAAAAHGAPALPAWLRALVAAFGRVGARPEDGDELRLRRSLLVATVVGISPLPLLWSALYAWHGELAAAAVPFGYVPLSFLALAAFALTRDYGWFSASLLAQWLTLPFVLSALLGGSAPSGGVELWSLMAPLGALALVGPRRAVWWFAGYLVLVVANGLLQASLAGTNRLPAEMARAFGTLNVIAVSAVAFAILLVFVAGLDRAYATVRRLFGQYLSRDVARALISDPSRAELGGAIVEVTALFADLQGFTTVSERSSPRELVALLNRYFGAVVPVIFAHGGTVIQFAGDAVVAVFNAPVPQARHALRAARAALALQREIERIAADDRDLPRFRVGINTGPALVGNVGCAELRNFLAQGDAVNVAARLQTAAEPGQVIVSATTYALIRDVAEARPLGRLAVKGKSEAVEAYLVERLRE